MPTAIKTKAPQKLCLLCMDRTGSNFLSSMLETHPKIKFYNEVFHRQYIIFADDRVVANPKMLTRRDRAPEAFVSQLWNGEFEPKEARGNYDAFGFKLFLNHNARALKHVINSDAKIILLKRRNHLARFSSFKIAAKTGVWKSSEGQKAPQITKLAFNENEFRAYIETFRNLEMMFEMIAQRWNRDYLSVEYEDFFAQKDVRENMVRYIGFDSDMLTMPSLQKQNTKDVVSRFSNRDEVMTYLHNTGNESWAQE